MSYQAKLSCKDEPTILDNEQIAKELCCQGHYEFDGRYHFHYAPVKWVDDNGEAQ